MTESLLHFKIGDSSRTMELLCPTPIRDSSWTQNPNHVTCPRCTALVRRRTWQCNNCGHTNTDTGQHPAWCTRCLHGETSA